MDPHGNKSVVWVPIGLNCHGGLADWWDKLTTSSHTSPGYSMRLSHCTIVKCEPLILYYSTVWEVTLYYNTVWKVALYYSTVWRLTSYASKPHEFGSLNNCWKSLGQSGITIPRLHPPPPACSLETIPEAVANWLGRLNIYTLASQG